MTLILPATAWILIFIIIGITLLYFIIPKMRLWKAITLAIISFSGVSLFALGFDLVVLLFLADIILVFIWIL